MYLLRPFPPLRRRFTPPAFRIAISTCTKPTFETVPTTPTPTRPRSSLPKGWEDLNLNFDTTNPIKGTVAHYDEHVLIATGKTDWTSRVEEEDTLAGQVIRSLKEGLKKPRECKNDLRTVLVTASSFRSERGDSVGAYLLPSFKYIPHIRPVQPPTPSGGSDRMSRSSDAVDTTRLIDEHLTQNPVLPASSAYTPVNEIVVLICGHGGRDSRCGTMGPFLQREFCRQLKAQGVEIVENDVFPSPNSRCNDKAVAVPPVPARVGIVSHIGGHVYAGNVIIYIPPTLTNHPLAGRGIWYGKVNAERIEGIVAETVCKGRVIEDIFRGAV